MSKITATTKGVLVSVDVNYQPQHSNTQISRFVFSYEVTIENLGKVPLQLLSRHWVIFESDGIKREVKGEGVVGKQPIIEPNAQHQYTSWCPIKQSIGYMQGVYIMKNLETEQLFEVSIPRFQMIEPTKMN